MHPARFIILRLFASKKVRYGVAGITFLFIIFMAIIIANFISLNPRQLYDQAYVPFIISTIHGDYNLPADSTESRYEQGNYKAIIQNARKKKIMSNEEQLLLGLSYLQVGDYSRSITHLEETAKGGGPFTRDAQFYLSMAYLLNQDYDQAIDRINHIMADPHNPYSSRFSESYIRKVKLLKWK